MMAESNYMVAMEDERYFLKMLGNLKYSNSTHFDTFLSKLFRNPACKDIIVDLREAEYLDSTNLGFLARIAGHVLDKFNRKLIVVSSNENINLLLSNIGFEDIMVIVKKLEKAPEHLEKIKNTGSGNMAKMMLESHKALMEINENNRDTFKNVVEMLEKEIQN